MAALDQFNLAPAAATLDPGAEPLIRRVVAHAAWAWFREHGDTRIKAKLGPFRPSVKLRALRDVWAMIFGPEPLAPAAEAPFPTWPDDGGLPPEAA